MRGTVWGRRAEGSRLHALSNSLPLCSAPSPARRNNIGDAGAIALAEQCLKSKTASLTKLDLSGNSQIGKAGATALAKCLKKNTSLAHLNLS